MTWQENWRPATRFSSATRRWGRINCAWKRAAHWPTRLAAPLPEPKRNMSRVMDYTHDAIASLSLFLCVCVCVARGFFCFLLLTVWWYCRPVCVGRACSVKKNKQKKKQKLVGLFFFFFSANLKNAYPVRRFIHLMVIIFFRNNDFRFSVSTSFFGAFFLNRIRNEERRIGKIN